MGYDLHIARRKHWPDKGADITLDEWLAYVQSDSELQLRPEMGPYLAVWAGPSGVDEPWFDWSDGQIFTKNPDAAIIDKMIVIARHFNATVQGDDGEIYESSRPTSRRTTRSMRERVTEWFRRLRPRSGTRIEHPRLPFVAGDRVRDTFGNEQTVVSIDPDAEHGIGVIRTRRDDGTELRYAMNAHGLTPVIKADQRWVDPAQLIYGPVQHESLTEEQLSRLKRLHDRLGSIDGWSLEKRTESFKRNLHLDRELAIFEKIADVCGEAYRQLEPLTPDQRREIYGLATVASGTTTDEVFKHYTPRTITREQAEYVLSLF